MPGGLKITDVVTGGGREAARGTTVLVRWRGTLNRGDEFGAGEVSFEVGQRRMLAGFESGVVGMRVGGVRLLRVSPHLGYRDRPVPGVPARAVLNFEVELLQVTGDPRDAESGAASDRDRP